ncbi:AraC family transcriptional regulator [Shewanella sp. NIFS-20-20]|uniref:helix-turn-helix domain-containing protein n=1 Tax=Shewanella sp. NIFS-20-20 TaxID=2853806 RepID=UPI001C44F266|nr:AraC family transcriptional regulator [Shewanella sp. NIFS-20-20]MBV7314308.1 AraC family transcriptional regulator [Shewanella sp. NIFS-20-20]
MKQHWVAVPHNLSHQLSQLSFAFSHCSSSVRNRAAKGSIDAIARVIDGSYSDPHFSVLQLATTLGMSIRQLQRIFRQQMALTPNQFIRDYRLHKAIGLLRSGYPVTTVLYSVGFTSPSYFTECFKSRYQMTPSEYCRLRHFK